VAAALVDMLELEGVEHVFGVPGGALLAILAELEHRPAITYHLCRQETGAAYLADGYARASGRLGVVLVTSGPGATNALTGAMNADAAGSPMLVISGEVPTAYFGKGYLQEGVDASLDVAGVYRAAVGYSEIVGAPSDFGELFCSALRAAWASPHGAAHISIPDDIAAAPALGPPVPTSTASYRPRPATVHAGGMAEVVDALATAERPLLMLGNRCRRPLAAPGRLDALRGCVERLSLPVVTDPDAKGIFPETHELSLRNYGIAGCEWPKYWLYDPDDGPFDLLVVMGSVLGSLATANWSPLLEPAGGIIHIDEDQAVVGRSYPLRLGLVGDIGSALDALADQAPTVVVAAALAERRRRRLAAIKRDHSPFADAGARQSVDDPIKPQALARLINERMGAAGHVYVDAGNCVGWALHDLVVDPPMAVHLSLAMGPMGFGVGSVVGAKLAAPGVRCLGLVGDGAFLMHLGEVATAAQYGVGAIWVVLADHDLAMVSQGMAQFTGDPAFEHYYTVAWADLAAAARGLGAEAYDASSTADTAAALDRALAGAGAGVPQVVAVRIDTSQAPPYYPPPYPPARPPGAGPGT